MFCCRYYVTCYILVILPAALAGVAASVGFFEQALADPQIILYIPVHTTMYLGILIILLALTPGIRRFYSSKATGNT